MMKEGKQMKDDEKNWNIQKKHKNIYKTKKKKFAGKDNCFFP